MSKENTDTLSHTRWNCKYHIVFAPKFRRQNIYGRLKIDIGKILRVLCERKRVVIEEAELCPDHIHMLVSIPPNLSVSQFMGYLKGKSSLIIFDRHANLKSGPPAELVVCTSPIRAYYRHAPIGGAEWFRQTHQVSSCC